MRMFLLIIENMPECGGNNFVQPALVVQSLSAPSSSYPCFKPREMNLKKQMLCYTHILNCTQTLDKLKQEQKSQINASGVQSYPHTP